MKFVDVCLLCLIAVVMTTAAVQAKKYYKHVDENGIVHYSDKKPQGVADFESWQVRVEDSQYEVKVVNRGTKRMPIFYAVNAYHGPVEIRLSFAQQQNVQADPPWPARYVVPAKSDLYLSTVKPINEQRGWSMRYRIDSALGDPKAQHDENHPYALPFVGSKNYVVSQAFGGEFSHHLDQSMHAVDIAMPEGSKVLASRAGVVMDVANDFYGGGVDAKHLSRANFVRILHDDGSMAVYAHLQLESVKVAKGQRVEKQQEIGRSGSTGFSSGPHLHFVIQANTGMKLQSVPFKWLNKLGQLVTPKVGPI